MSSLPDKTLQDKPLPNKVKLRIWPGGSWQQSGTEWNYVSALPIMGVMVAPNITHSKLVRCVQHKCPGINPSIGKLKIAYQYSGQTYELLDTEDVQGFMQSAAAVRNPPTLFVYVDPEGFHTNNNVSGGSSSGWENNVSVAEESSSSFCVGGGSNSVREPDFCAVEQTQSYVPQFQHEDEHRVYGYNNDFLSPSNYAYSESNPKIVPETQFYVPQFQHDYLSPNNYGYSEYNPEIVLETQERVEEPCGDEEEEEDESHVYHLDIPGITSEEEDDEEDGEEDEDGESSPIKSYSGINDFFGQPPPLPDRDDNLITPPQAPVGYNRSNRVNEGDIFVTKDELTLALGRKFVEEGYQYYVERSSNSRFEARCRDRSCDWRLYAANVKDSIMFQVRVMNDVHVCSRTQMHPNHRNANKRVLGHIILPKVQDVSRKLRGSDIMKDIKDQYNVDISYSQAWRAKAFALALVRGDPHDSYRRLPGFFYNLELQNPGTFYRIQTDIAGRFNLCFYALGCAIRSFTSYLRPVIILDGAHLKGPYLGTMFLAVAMDGNNQIFMLAFGVGKSESGEGWTYFLSNLRQCINEPEGLVFISDRAGSIRQAINTVYPGVHHALCTRHLMMNMKSRDNRIEHYKTLFWKACKAYTERDFDIRMAALRAAVPVGVQVLERDTTPERWSRAKFPGMRYNIMTSNSAESVNALSRYARKLPIVPLMDYFRSMQQDWYSKRRNNAGYHLYVP